MATDTEETAKRLRTEAGYRRGCNGDDMPAYELFGKLAGLVDPQER